LKQKKKQIFSITTTKEKFWWNSIIIELLWFVSFDFFLVGSQTVRKTMHKTPSLQAKINAEKTTLRCARRKNILTSFFSFSVQAQSSRKVVLPYYSSVDGFPFSLTLPNLCGWKNYRVLLYHIHFCNLCLETSTLHRSFYGRKSYITL